MDRTHRRSGIPPEIGVFALVAAASLPLARLFRPPSGSQLGYGQVQMYTLIVGALVAWGLRRMRVPTLFSAVLSGLAFLWFAAALFVPQALTGPFPTPHAVRVLIATMQTGLRLSNTEVAPVGPVPAFLMLASIGIWASYWLADDAAVRLRHPLLAIGLTLPMFAMPGTLIRGGHSWVEVAIFAAAALVVMFQDERARLARWAGVSLRSWQPGLAARIGLVAVVLAVFTAPLLPGYGQAPGGSIRANKGARLTVNPLVSIRPSLDHFPSVNLFRVHARAESYWRLTSLDSFNGTVWTATPDNRTVSLAHEVRRSSPAPVVERVEQSITIQNLAGPWVPTAFEPVGVRGIRGVGLQPVTRTLVASGGFHSGQKFSVLADVPVPTSDDLEHDTGPDAVGDRYLSLPGNLPPVVRSLAEFVTSQAGTRLEKAIALQDYLRRFDYDLEVALHHGYSDLVRFLTEVRAGYCEQFASAMAVMARAIGIPARVAVGFGTGELVEPDTYQVGSQHAHAWVEVHFPSFGWMAFEPTPRTDGFDVPGYTRFAPGAAQPTVAPTSAPATSTPSPSATATPSRDRGDQGAAIPSGGGPSRRVVLPAAVGGGTILLLLLGLPGMALVRRVLRRRRAHSAPQAVGVRYVEFLEWCRAASLGRYSSETPVEHARRIGLKHNAAGPALAELAVLATAAVYAGDAITATPETVAERAEAARKAIASSVPRRRRILPVLGWGWWKAEDRAAAFRRR
ncbi:MAG: DUF3488 and DUF4129 domain-containing transglutaminase family protein [Actinomycetota bacterium]|nr:DUF3488 and transglutaminase-like domain-containing protein [Actinomycetota bacterium]